MKKNYIWLVFGYALLTMLLFFPAQKKLIEEGRDIRQDYIGAQRLLANIDLYSEFSKAELERIDVDTALGMPMNFHPPTTLLFFIPFSLLNFDWAVIFWNFISLLAFYMSIYLITEELSLQKLFLFAIVAVLWFPLWLHIRFGQFSTLILFFLTLFWINFRRNKQVFAGIFLAIPILLKIFPLPIIILIFFNKQWKALLWCILIIIVVVVAIYVYQPNSIVDFIVDVAPNNNIIFRSYFGNFSLNGFLGRLFIGAEKLLPVFNITGVNLSILYYVVSLMILISALIVTLFVNDFDLNISLLIIVSLIISPTTWAHYFVILVLPGIILYQHFNKNGSKFQIILFLALIVVSFFPHWQYYEWLKSLDPTKQLPGWLNLTSPGFYILIGMMILCLLQMADYFTKQNLNNFLDSLIIRGCNKFPPK